MPNADQKAGSKRGETDFMPRCQRARGALRPTTSAPGTGRRLEDASGRARVRIYGSAPCRTDLRTYRTARDEWRNAGSSHRSSLSHCRVRNVRNKSRLLTASLLSESRAPPAIVRDLICGAAHLPLFLRVSAERSADRPDLARSLHSPLSSQPALFTYLRRPPSLA